MPQKSIRTRTIFFRQIPNGLTSQSKDCTTESISALLQSSLQDDFLHFWIQLGGLEDLERDLQNGMTVSYDYLYKLCLKSALAILETPSCHLFQCLGLGLPTDQMSHVDPPIFLPSYRSKTLLHFFDRRTADHQHNQQQEGLNANQGPL